MDDIQWATKLIESIEKKKRELLKDQRASASYWSGGDSWISGSDMSDATNWVDRQLAEFVLEKIKSRKNNATTHR